MRTKGKKFGLRIKKNGKRFSSGTNVSASSRAYYLSKRQKKTFRLCSSNPQPQRAFRLSGQAPIISHAIIVGFTIFLVYVVITTFTSLRDDYQKFVGGLEVKELCFVMKGSVEKVYTPADYNLSVNALLGQVEVRLPDRLTDLKYNAKFFNRTILIESPGAEFNDTCKVGFMASYNGSTSGGLTRFSYIRLTNGTNVIEMVKV